MIRKVLVANRGEIAVRIIRACHELGKTAVAVFCDADRSALHVQHADEAYRLGPPAPEASYLNIAAIIDAARRSGAGAIHPGYGFVSETPRFAEACAEAGIIFIGPSPEAMRAMGDKAAAKQLAKRTGIPTVPGYTPKSSPPLRGRASPRSSPPLRGTASPQSSPPLRGRVREGGPPNPDTPLVRAARKVGYPLLVKASGGGGGRGMRVVQTQTALREALSSARREAESAFGDGRLLLERYISPARHIEVQVIADNHGHVVALGERECSLQRRHQKVLEEAPAPGLDSTVRSQMLDAAARLAQAVGYVSAGTVEFILDPKGRFYFLEMNTRLQVEHGVTELVSALDLVQLQLQIADGEPLPFEDAPPYRGHAIECRIYAEDPFNGFRPSAGSLLLFEPPEGPGIRNDVGVSAGDVVSPHYDPQLAKLLVHAPDRPAAIRRLQTALGHYIVAGVATNLPLLRTITRHPAFTAGLVHTRFLEDELVPTMTQPQPQDTPEEVLIAAAAFDTTRIAPTARSATNPWQALGRSGLSGSARHFQYRLGESTRAVSLTQIDDGWRANAGGQDRRVSWREAAGNRIILNTDDRTLTFHGIISRDAVTIVWRGETYVLHRPQRSRLSPGAVPGASAGHRGLTAPMPALVAKVLVREGDRVSPRQTLVVLQAMKMEHLIQAATAGVVKAVRYREGDSVPEGAVLVEITGEE